MIVSWNWLKEYVSMEMDQAELEHRLSMAGLNHEGTESVGDDLAIDLEVTSNRPDCLGHIGVAREIAVLWNQSVQTPTAPLAAGKTPVSELCKVRIDCPELCYRYIARVIRGVTITPSPNWLAQRLKTLGISSINNVVDVTNYVTMECGQPLHAFDYAMIKGRQIIVRSARDREPFEAIDHRIYSLTKDMCVIADTERSVALGGVMGGVDSEVSDACADVLIEAADFDPLAIRNAARKLNLHSPSSYRFERGVDPDGVDWASRRCCELILELAGGELAEGSIDVIGREYPDRNPIVLRLSQLPRILGIDLDREEVRRILLAIGNAEISCTDSQIKVVPPSWRRDLTREIDLIEEVARIHGYDEIPEDASVPMVPSHRTNSERVLDAIRSVLTGAGYSEALTASVVSRDWSNSFSPWSNESPLKCRTPMLRGADRLRRSLIPSLLDTRRINESLGNFGIKLFETAKVYLPSAGSLPREPWILGIISDGGFREVKGVVEYLLNRLNPTVELSVFEFKSSLLIEDQSCKLTVGDQLLGFIGDVAPEGLKQFGLRGETTVAEIDISALEGVACLIPQYDEPPSFPAIHQDLNLILHESVPWADLAKTITQSAGPLLEQLDYRETYRDADRDGPGKKRMLFSMTFRASDRTLVAEEADSIRNRVIDACSRAFEARLLA